MLADLQRQPQPVTILFDQCQKDEKHVDIKHVKQGSKNIASVYVNGELITSNSDQHKETAKLHAAKEALELLPISKPKPKPHDMV